MTITHQKKITASTSTDPKLWMGVYWTQEREKKRVYFEAVGTFNQVEKLFQDNIPEPYIKALLRGSAPSESLLKKDGFEYMPIHSSQKVESSKGVDIMSKKIKVKDDKDYFYDNVSSLDEDELDVFKKLGWIKEDAVLIPAGTVLKYQGNAGNWMIYKVDGTDDLIYFNNTDSIFEEYFDEDFDVLASKAACSSEDIDEDDLETAEQEFTSKNTSINKAKLPSIYKLVNFPKGSLVIDYGGGRYDNGAEFLDQEKDCTGLVYDPFNRTADHNREVVRQCKANGGADIGLCSNVLNVIKEPEARLTCLKNISKLVKPGGDVYITVYEGSGTGEGGQSQEDSYQLNRKTADYLEEIQEVFPDAVRKGKLIKATNTQSVKSSEAITCEVHGLEDVKDMFEDGYQGNGWFEDEIELDKGDGKNLASYLKDLGYRVKQNLKNKFWFLPGECYWTDDTFYTYRPDPELVYSSITTDAAPYKVAEKCKELQDDLYNAASELMQSPEFGFTLEDIADYLVIEVTPIYDDADVEHSNAVGMKAEVRAEMSYEGMSELAEALNPIVETIDKDAYFDHLTGGIIDSYVYFPKPKRRGKKSLLDDVYGPNSFEASTTIECDEDSDLRSQIYDYLDEIGGYADYNQKVEDVAEDFDLDIEDAELYVNDWIQDPSRGRDYSYKDEDNLYDVYPEDVVDLIYEIKKYIDQPKGYQLFYELEKRIVDEGLDNSILYDVAADFAWDGTLNKKVNELARADGREDLVNEDFIGSSKSITCDVMDQDMFKVAQRAADVQTDADLNDVFEDLLSIDKILYQKAMALYQKHEYSPAALGKIISDDILDLIDDWNQFVKSSETITATYKTKNPNYCPHCTNMTLTEVEDGHYVCDECGEEYTGVPSFNGGLELTPIEESKKVTCSKKTYQVDVGGWETFEIEAESEDEALEIVKREYLDEDDLEELEADPHYIWIRPDEEAEIESSVSVQAGKLVDTPQEVIDDLLEILKDYGFVLDPSFEPNPGRTWMGEVHIQVINTDSWIDTNADVQDQLQKYVPRDMRNKIHDLERGSNCPITWNFGVGEDFHVTGGLDIMKQWVPDDDEDSLDDVISSTEVSDEDQEEFYDLEDQIYEALKSVGGDLDDFQGDIQHSSYLNDRLILAFETATDRKISSRNFKKSVEKALKEALQKTRFNSNIEVGFDERSRSIPKGADVPKDFQWYRVSVEAWANDNIESSIESSETSGSSWKREYNSELEREEYSLHADLGKAFIYSFDDDGRWGYHATVDLNTGRHLSKSFYLKDSLDEAKKYCETRLKISETSVAASYGGAYDIKDDQYFTKEELVEFGDKVTGKMCEYSNIPFELEYVYLTGNLLEVAITDGDYTLEAKVQIDMRRIRNPIHLYKYEDEILNQLKHEYKQYHDSDAEFDVLTSSEEILTDEHIDYENPIDLNKVYEVEFDFNVTVRDEIAFPAEDASVDAVEDVELGLDIAKGEDLVDDILSLAANNLPEEDGTYNISGVAHMKYHLDNIYNAYSDADNRDELPGHFYSTDEADVDFIEQGSWIENLVVSPMEK